MQKTIYLLLFVFFFNTVSYSSHHEPATSPPEPQVLVIFGASGDLTKRKLIPALAKLAGKGQLPEQFVVLGIGRRKETDSQFRESVSVFIEEKDMRGWQRLANHVFYLGGDFQEEKLYRKLAKRLRTLQGRFKTDGNALFYLATPPLSFAPIIKQLHGHGLTQEDTHWSRVIIEKPFGQDTDSAISLHNELTRYLKEEQIYLIDHYLGKEVLHNLLVLRFTNFVLENLWSHEHIDHVTITLSEDIGVESRGAFWEKTGLLRDVVQNHIMQMVSLLAMEKPKSFVPKHIHEEKTRLIESVRPFSEATISRGQYGSGIINGKAVPAYREEKDVDPHSSVETFVAAELYIDNPRWEGVPFYIKAGKRLSKRLTEIIITFKSEEGMPANQLVLRIQPDEEISLTLNALIPGFRGEMQPVKLNWPLSKVEGITIPEAYERLLHEAMNGQKFNFVSYAEVLAAWKLFTPVLKEWEEQPPQDFPNYSAGSDGPVIN